MSDPACVRCVALLEARSARADAAARLAEWADSWTIGRFHQPTYNNPGELKDDLRLLLAAVGLPARSAGVETHTNADAARPSGRAPDGSSVPE